MWCYLAALSHSQEGHWMHRRWENVYKTLFFQPHYYKNNMILIITQTLGSLWWITYCMFRLQISAVKLLTECETTGKQWMSGLWEINLKHHGTVCFKKLGIRNAKHMQSEVNRETTKMDRNHSSSSPVEMCCFFRNLILSSNLHLTDLQHAFTKCNVKSIREDRGRAVDS